MRKELFCEEWTVETAQLMEIMPSADRKNVRLPHDMLIEQKRVVKNDGDVKPVGGWKSNVMRGCWPTGTYKYSKSFFVPKAWKERTVYLLFEGVYRDAQVLVNDDYSTEFEASWQQDIRSMIDSSYNHPSVIMYSIGNELPDVANPVNSSWGRIISEKIKSLDTTRFTINCINGLVGLSAVQDDTPNPEIQVSSEDGKEQAGGILTKP